MLTCSTRPMKLQPIWHQRMTKTRLRSSSRSTKQMEIYETRCGRRRWTQPRTGPMKLERTTKTFRCTLPRKRVTLTSCACSSRGARRWIHVMTPVGHRCMRHHDPDTLKSRACSSITAQTSMRGIGTSGLQYTSQQTKDMTSFWNCSLNVAQTYMHVVTRAKHHMIYCCREDIERWLIYSGGMVGQRKVRRDPSLKCHI